MTSIVMQKLLGIPDGHGILFSLITKRFAFPKLVNIVFNPISWKPSLHHETDTIRRVNSILASMVSLALSWLPFQVSPFKPMLLLTTLLKLILNSFLTPLI